MLNKINEAVSFIQGKVDFKGEIGIILGTGLGGLVNEIDLIGSIDYADIPHLVAPMLSLPLYFAYVA